MFFSLFFYLDNCAHIAEILSVCSSGTAACLHQQVLRISSAMLQLVLQCGYFHSRRVFAFVTVLEFGFTDDGHSQVRNVEKFYYIK